MTDDIISAYEVSPGVAQITMQDKNNRNTFTNEFMEELIKKFTTIGKNPNYKVIVLTGYDSYFASGGTKEALLAIHEKKIKFTDTDLYRVALDCEIPVVSAMQGHGIGGGLIMGLFADFVVMAQDRMYAANFMRYGFTPGMGATYILPKKFGLALGHEMLMSGENYSGDMLAKRGVPFSVVHSSNVLKHAYTLAASIAEKPRVSLVELKKNLTEGIKAHLIEIVAQELAMHDKTFHQPEVVRNINTLFGL